MFLCEKCHQQAGCGRCIVPYSHGICELCHMTDICYDCKGHKRDLKAEPIYWGDPETKVIERKCPKCGALMSVRPEDGVPHCHFCGYQAN